MKDHYLQSLSDVRHWFNWLPAPVASTLLLCFAASLAFLFIRVIMQGLPRLPGIRRIPGVHTVTSQLGTYIRFLLMLIFAGAALPAATGLSSETTHLLAKLFLFLFIVILGFGIIRAFRLATDAYLLHISQRSQIDDIAARSHQTQIKVLRRLIEIVFGVITVGAALMVFDAVQRYGVSLFASAGAASLVVGLSARPALTNLLAGIQIAVTQPIRMEDMLILNGDWAWVEEINATYVVLRTWDKRRYIVPISYFLENPFQNWTHSSPALTGSVFLWLDYRTPMDRIRTILNEEITHCTQWDGDRKGVACQVADSNAEVMSVRIIAGAADAGSMWDLCCALRERMLHRIHQDMPEAFPRRRTTMVGDGPDGAAWPDSLLSPPVNRPDSGAYAGPNLQGTRLPR